MDRRLFLASAAAGVTTAGLAALVPAAAHAAPVGTLPGEVSRVSNAKTAAGTLYDNIEVRIGDDLVRLFIPQGLSRTTATGAVWFFHGAGSDHNALNNGFRYPAELVMDERRSIAVCPAFGGTQFTGPVAQEALARAWEYVSSRYRTRLNFFRATSAGGALSTWAYGTDAIPYIRGLYLVNGVYDMEELAARDASYAALVGSVYGSRSALVENNPARLPAGAFEGSRIKVVVSDEDHPDTSVPPKSHGLLLADRVVDVALDLEVDFHELGHGTPSWTHRDMITTFRKWTTA